MASTVDKDAMKRNRNEKRIEAYLKDRVHAAGGICVKLDASLYRGIPDRMCIMPSGRTVYVEVKEEGFTPAPAQLFWIRKLRRIGHDAGYIDSTEQATGLVNHFKSNKKGHYFAY